MGTSREVILAIALLVTGAPLAAQEVIPSRSAPLWTRAWSPLRWTAQLPRTLPGAVASLPSSVHWPTPRAGLFWTAGNPAALPFDVTASFGVVGAATGSTDGTYRRPLDPDHTTATSLSGLAWRPFGGAGAAIGNVTVAHRALDGARSDFDLAYPGSPYVVMDTAASDLGRTEALLEGAAGWKIGHWAAGLALGYRAQRSRTQSAPVPRVLSAADPGASAGIVWSATPAFNIGVHGRWRAHAERVLLYSIAAASRVYLLQGFYEPPPQDVASGYYERRMEREGVAAGIEAGGRTGALAWTAFVERGTQEERQHPTGDNSPESDTWNADAWTAGGAFGLHAGHSDVLLSARYTTLSGEAARAGLPDTVPFIADESVLDAGADVAIRVSGAVRLLARATLRRESHARTDNLARIGSDLQAWTTGIGAGISFAAAPRLELGAALALAAYGGGGTLPDPTAMGPAFNAYIAPALALMASDATARAASASLLWDCLPGSSLSLAIRYQSLNAAESTVLLEGSPVGDRTAWSAELGIVLAR